MIITERLNIIEATEADIPAIIELEEHKDNRDYLFIGTYEEHLEEISSPNYLLWVFKKKEGGAIVGYAFAQLDFKSDKFLLRRIAISEKGLGYGRESLKALIKYAFEEMNMNRFWLDVYPFNERGIHLYESLGMKRDGTMRQNYKDQRGYLDQMIYSLLREEYDENKSIYQVGESEVR